VPPFLEADVAQARTFYPGPGTAALAVVAPLIADRDYCLECVFAYRAGDAGVIFALGDPIAGFALYARDGVVSFVYQGGKGELASCDDLPVVDGDNRFELRHRALGERRGRGTLVVNGREAGTLDCSPTTILGLGVGEGLDIGMDRKLHVSARYGGSGTCAYTNRIDHVRIEPGAHPADSYANRPERLAQRD
jgi:arylsulfatase